ncbi:hypothetical protein SARC_04996 [Sphaeroforma arctica JP610]|uniref:Uncharacterized protein n=1 Tax=Sphaeroforma arctica JP610 TaxID=667725 RepID=A0A0L0G0X8_9EUKA|nr:hypothetical protein SARC_04996 [Sphaeroforma arctica JP610]KNC82725.1 hypothetical protein SARC_04996 [Sphaeroforma arctica JP610]|eukprot:XP_014156627.1 hypothetical protein SARC_04996 [Sphaeroforma arctica JP610]
MSVAVRELACLNIPILSEPVTDGIIFDVSFTTSQMTLVLSSTMTDSRIYDSVVLNACSSANYVSVTSTSIASTGCQDRITLVVDIADLNAVCSVAATTALFPDNYIKRSYTGSVTLNMREFFLNELEVLEERSFSQVLGFAADFDTGIVVPDVVETHTNSPLGLYAAVSNLDTTPSTYAVVDVTFFMTYPLHVSNPLLGVASVVSSAGTTYCTNPTDYVPVCTKTIQLQIAHGTACSLDGNYKFSSISIGCGIGVDALDCPLTATDTSSWFAFDIALPSLCDDTGYDVMHDDVVAIASFNTVWTDPEVPQTAFVFGGQMNFAAGFSGMAVQS